ncbi:phage portal protein [Aerococcaceae bacterium zg-252]|nr:phage portal protein [Facklamia sp. 252]NEW68778.1 phage portal protein [Facklamia sp. 253]QQD64729.1 phage portal protein [Aerococcaceae bacterium zg-252]
MGLWNKIMNFFRYGGETVTTLNTFIDHPKIAVTSEEYNRILNNLKYYKSSFDDVKFLNSDGDAHTRKFHHLPIGRTACKKIASLVFNEQAEFKIDDEGANEFINQVLKNDRFNKNFERYLESALALGGMAMRPYVDGKDIKVAFIQAPVFLPLQSNTQDVSSAAIIMRSVKSEGSKQKYYSLIEFHEWQEDSYIVTNELYKSDTEDRVGERVPLSELYEGLKDEVPLSKLSRPLFTYLKTPGMNNKNINSPLGLSLFDNAKSTIDFLNRTFDEFTWEVRMGQRRVAVPEQTVKTVVDHFGNQKVLRKHFDPDQNVFVQIGGGDIDKQIGITDLTTPIRSESYIQAINEGLSLFEMQIGVSAGMFTFDGKSMKTATEVVSENSDTYQMRNSIVSLVEHSLKELIISICELGSLYGLYHGVIPNFDDISINLDDGVFTDKSKELEYWSQMVASGFASSKTAIMKLHGVTEEKALEMLNEIKNEMVQQSNNVRSEEDIDVYGE